MNFAQVAQNIDHPTYTSLKTGLELGRWPNGQPLTQEQKEISMEAVLLYEAKNNVPLTQRVGYVPPKKSKPAANQAPVQEFVPE